ncbi:reverse transcriptase domain-containing protein [Tanacetum coccineum]|uniref:Reverse transcriptase domain-containing protein n=1 Tax=Tanacetum coccineum TaxID=301880 RepID=A0ABQ4XVM0_9ASTR
MDEMMRVTTSFLRGEVAASNHERKKSFPPWKQQEGNQKQNFRKGNFRNQQRPERKQDRFTLLTKTPKEIFALKKAKFKAPPPMTTPVEKRNHDKFCEFHDKFCEFHGEVGNNKDESIYSPPLDEDEGTEGPMIIEAKNRKQLHTTIRMANTITGNNQRRRALRFDLDEFCGRKITIPIQWNYWKAGSQEVSSSSVNSSRNAEDPVAEQPLKLNVREGCQPIRQKKRGQAAERNIAINEEVSKLVTAGIMREVHYHDWLSNPVMVKKHDDSWRMCVDFKDLNKACPKDGYPLPEIDWKVESLCGFPFKCFLDAYKGYHQIQMAEEDEEKTAFITNQGIFCYTKMPFGLRNAGATYQRLVDRAFHGQIGRNLEVYVDDLVIKSHTEDEVVRDIEETFRTLRKINMKLNPKKCTFGVEEGMFLGYQVNTKGIKICPDKVDAVLSLQSPKCLKDVQKLNGKLASLNRFLAKSAEKSLPFFKTLKKCTKKSDFLWTEEAESAFKQMKELVAKLPMLIAPEENKELIIYLAASKEAVSTVLMTEREAKQMPIYFVSRALRGPEVNYTSMEKLVLALVHAIKRLRRYFQVHLIVVITDQPIKNILSNPEVAGQVLVDFIVERPEEENPDASAKEEEPLSAQWTLFTDGSSCVDGCGAGVIVTNPEGIEFTYALRFQFKATNNEAEYEALIAGLRIAEKMGVQNLQVNVDSKLVVDQVNRTYIAKETDMVKYLEKVKTLAKAFREFSINQVPRKENKKADALSKMASTSFAHLSKQVLVEELKEKSVNEVEVLAVVEEGDSWMTPIQEYLNNETLPAEREKARSIKRKSQRFAIINGTLYKKYFLGPWLRCVGPSQANYVLREIREGRKGAYKSMSGMPSAQTRPKKSAGKIEPNHISVAILQIGFGLPGEIISDNGKQFRDNPFRDWCEKLCIQQHFASVKHPQTNGLVERANRSLGEGIKARLGKDNKNWLEEISHVLWAHRTMIKSSNGDTPFSLTYGTEAVIPAEIGMPTFRTAEVDVAKNDEALEINLELLEEKREQAAIREAKSKRQMEKYYNTKVRNASFKPGDLVYRSNEASRVEDTGKLGPKWEGPYEVTEALGKGSYKLKDRNGRELPRTWNVCNLKKCYIHKV